MTQQSCNRCGQCCNWAGWFLFANDPVKLEWLYARAPGVKVRVVNDDWVDVLLPHRCQHLTDDNKCAIHDNKPQLCREFPIDGQELLDGCGFKA
jgi:Fe-S-cluster containining protein